MLGCFNYKIAYMHIAWSKCLLFVFRLGSTCNHVAALLFKIDYAWQHGLTQGHMKPSTSLPNSWAAPTFRNMQPMKVSDMVFEKPKLRRPAWHHLTNSVKTSTAKRKLFEPTRSSDQLQPLTLHEVTAALYPECSSAVAFRYSHFDVLTGTDPSHDTNVAESIDCTEISQEYMQSFVDCCKNLPSVDDAKAIVLTSDQVERIEKETRGQSDNNLWFIMREGRISASIAHEFKTRTVTLLNGKSTDPSSLISICLNRNNSKLANIPAVKYGKENEEEALQAYTIMQRSKHRNFAVSKCGLFVDAKHPYMCATPDSVVSCDCCGLGVVEVKCPFKSVGKHPYDADISAGQQT